MSTKSLARIYRPHKFTGPQGLVGQSHVIQTLTNALKSGRPAQAYLLTGPRGTGKTTTARVLGAALNCENPVGVEPCGECLLCLAIYEGRENSDVLEIDGATNRGAEDARALRAQVHFAASRENAWKVYIIDECHMLTREAWNALLKVLEEPPRHVCFIFCTTEPHKVEQTASPVMSRVQRLDLRRLTQEEVEQQLQNIAGLENIQIEEEARRMIARQADGGMRDALSALDQIRAFQGEGQTITLAAVRAAQGMQSEDFVLGALEAVWRGERERLFKLIEYLRHTGADYTRFLEEWQEAVAALAWCAVGGTPKGWTPKGINKMMKLVGRQQGTNAPVGFELPGLGAALAVLLRQAQEDAVLLRQAAHPDLVLLATLQRAVTSLGPALETNIS